MKSNDEEMRSARPSVEALRSSYGYILWGLLWGTILLLLAEGFSALSSAIEEKARLHNDLVPWSYYAFKALKFFSEHLGIGFYVSSIAVYFYEWGAHAQRFTQLMAKYEAKLDRLNSMIGGKAKKALTSSLRELLGTEQDDDKRVDLLSKLAGEIGNLSKSHSSVKEQYMEVVLPMLEEIKHNVGTLVTLGRRERSENVSTFEFTAAHQVVSAVLAAQMQAMGNGDEYTVVSDLSSWKSGQLKTFQAKTETAVRERGVVVRRIFNLHLGGPLSPPKEEVKNILDQHMQDSVAWSSIKENGLYEIALFGHDELERLKLSPSDTDRAKREHCGFFKCGAETVQFDVRDSDLSYIELGAGREAQRRLFDQMWAAAQSTKRIYRPAFTEEERLRFITYAQKRGRSGDND